MHAALNLAPDDPIFASVLCAEVNVDLTSLQFVIRNVTQVSYLFVTESHFLLIIKYLR